MKKNILLLIILSILFAALSCKTSFEVDIETQKICKQRNYDGDYIFEAWRKERNGDEIIRMGQASVVIEKCILSVPDLFGADLRTDDVEKWLGLKGLVNKRGKVRGQVAMDTCFGKYCGIDIIIFSGEIEKEELFASLKNENVLISLRKDSVQFAEIPKIGMSQKISTLALKDKSLKYLSINCNFLKSLHLGKCLNITAEGLKLLSKGCKYLQSLNLAGCYKISEKGICFIAINCKGLQVLNISGCELITMSGLKELIHGLKYVEIDGIYEPSRDNISYRFEIY